MMRATDLRERLTSAIAAIALQAGMLALLAFSFAVVRHADVEKETFLTLPPLAQTPPPPPMVIDARGRPKRITPTAPLPAPDRRAAPAILAPAPPGNAPQAAPAQAQAQPACIPAGQARPANRVACPPPPPQAQSNDLPLHPQSHVKDEAHWQAEMAHKNDPLGVSGPGGSIGPGGVGLQLTIQDPLCKMAGLFMKLHCGAVPVYHTSTDAQFKAALAATQARTRSIYGKPVLASPPQTGGGNEKSGVSGGTAGPPDPSADAAGPGR